MNKKPQRRGDTAMPDSHSAVSAPKRPISQEEAGEEVEEEEEAFECCEGLKCQGAPRSCLFSAKTHYSNVSLLLFYSKSLKDKWKSTFSPRRTEEAAKVYP